MRKFLSGRASVGRRPLLSGPISGTVKPGLRCAQERESGGPVSHGSEMGKAFGTSFPLFSCASFSFPDSRGVGPSSRSFTTGAVVADV